MYGEEKIECGERMEDPRDGHSDKGASQRVVGKPLREFTGPEPLDQVLLDWEVQPKGVAFHEHQVGQPEPVVERQDYAAKGRYCRPRRRLEPAKECWSGVRPVRRRWWDHVWSPDE